MVSPGYDVQQQGISFTLGTCNPTGLSHKASHFGSLPGGLWGIAETQTTETGFRYFQNDLRIVARDQDRSLRAIHGAYAPPRSGSSSSGAWTGVGFVSIRPLYLPCRGYEYLSGRLHAADCIVGAHHVVGAVVYAPPSGPTYGSTTSLCNDLLLVVTENIVCGSGLRYVLGDFNRDVDSLATFDYWRSLGWQEVQMIGLQRWGRQRVPTSKDSAFSDHLWVSPELAAYLVQVEVMEDSFSDHHALCGRFVLPHGHLHQWHWHSPVSFPWDALKQDLHVTGPTFDSEHFQNDPTASFASWSNNVEKQIIHSFESEGTTLPRGIHGRGQTTATYKRPLALPPLRHGRCGDEMPKSDFLNRSMHLWFRQLRRVQAFAQRSKRAATHPAWQVDQMFTWRNILRARGFKGGFAKWWLTRPIRLHGSPAAIPTLPPRGDLALVVFMDFRANYRKYEQWQLQRKKQVIATLAFDHNKLLYRQLRPRDFSPPDFFTLQEELTIAVINTDLTAEFHEEATLPDSASWKISDEDVQVQFLTPSIAKIETDRLLMVGQTLHGRHLVTDFRSMDDALAKLWQPIWQRHSAVPIERW